MTDNEIIKALECSVKDKCPECPYFHSYPCDKCRNMRADALDLINRQKAEIELLRTTLQKVSDGLGEAKGLVVKDIAKAKAEAYKEFAERLKKHSYYDHKDQRNVVAEVIIDHYLKEMIGE